MSVRSRCLTFVLAGSIAFQTAFAKDCESVVGKIDGILSGKERIEKATDDQVTLRRKDAGIPVSNGLPLCAGDVVSVFTGTTLYLKMGKTAEEENAITLFGGTRTELSADDSIKLLVGRFFAFLKGPFRAATPFGLLGAQGTAFQAEASESSLSVLQVENSVSFDPLGTAESKPRRRRREDPAMRVSRLQKLTVGKGAEPPKTEPYPAEQCRNVVDGDSRVVTRTRPQYAARVIGTDLDGVEAARVFEANRGEALCEGGAAARTQVGRAYAAWGRAADAVEVLGEPLPGADAQTLNDTGNAYRLAGDLDRALRFYAKAIERDPRFAFPYNGTGDAHRDRALKALGRGNVADALNDLQEARKWYEKSLEPSLQGKEGGHNRAVPLYSLGEMELLLAYLEPANGEEHCRSAETRFGEALSQARFPFAQVGLARVQLMRAQLIRGQAAPEDAKFGEKLAVEMANALTTRKQREPLLEGAEREIREALKRWPSLSLAEQTLGEILELRGERNQAVESLQRAVRLDPNNAVAYARLGSIGGKDRKQFQRVAAMIEPKAAAEITRGRVALAEPLASEKAPLPHLEVRSPRLDFTARGTQSVTLRNAGPGPLKIAAVALQSQSQAVKVVANTCAGKTLSPGEECLLSIEAGPGDYDANLVVQHGGADSPLTVPVHANIPFPIQ